MNLLSSLLPSLLPLAQQRPDGPGPKILGWLIVFVMIVWPILRGAIEAANERRRKFVEDEKRRAGGGSQGGRGLAGRGRVGPGRTSGPPMGQDAPADPFESLRRALEGRLEKEEARPESRTEPRHEPRPATMRRMESAAAQPRDEAPPALRPTGVPTQDDGSLVGDPFDDQILERALVDDAGRSKVPSDGGARPTVTERRFQPKPRPPFDAPSAMDPSAAALARVARRVRTPWGLAVVYEELLGPPVSMREPRF